jgi:hypothetical protein
MHGLVTTETVGHCTERGASGEWPTDTDYDNERVSIAVTLFIPIQEALRSNLDCGIGCPDWRV